MLPARRCITAVLTPDARQLIATVQPAFVATASKSGKPNVSPKGSLRVIDDEHVAFAEIASPKTIANLKENPRIAVIVLDPATWAGCRLAGTAEIVESGNLMETFRSQFEPLKMKVRSVVRIKIEEISMMPPMKAGSKG